MARHLAIDCGRQVGYPFVQVFLFEPKGTTLYVGDMGSVRDKTKELPTCHGVVMFWQFKQVTCKRIALFGTNTRVPGFDLHHANRCHSTFVPEYVRPMLKERMRYILTYMEASGKTELVNTWRRMPSCYLGDVFEKYLKDREQRKVPVSNLQGRPMNAKVSLAEELARSTKKAFAFKNEEDKANMMNEWLKASQIVLPFISKEDMSKMIGFAMEESNGNS